MPRALAEEKAGKDTILRYGKDDRVTLVIGNNLWEGENLLINQNSKLRDVLKLMGQPRQAWSQHVFLTVGGRFWDYGHLNFSFVDDLSQLGLEAPLFRVRLGIPLGEADK